MSEQKQEWCRDIVYVPIRGWTMFDYINKFYLDMIVAGDWKFCPICGKPRPHQSPELLNGGR